MTIRQRIERWWQSRLPATDTWALGQRNIYILPTRAGLAFGLTLLVMLLAGGDRRHAAMQLKSVMQPGELQAAQDAVLSVRASEPLLDYLQALILATRTGAWFTEGLSPRAGIAVLRAAKARAFMAERDYVSPDDVQAILPQAIAHRLTPVAGCGRGPIEQVRAMVEATPIP